MKVVINALQCKQNSSGIGVMIRNLFGPYTQITQRSCEVLLPHDGPEFPCGERTKVVRTAWNYSQALGRVWFQTVQMGRRYGKDAVLLTTDSKLPFFLPKSCVAAPLITDLAVYRMPEVYKTSRVFLWKLQYHYVKRRANFFFAISQFTKDEMVQLLHIAPERIHLVPCACDEAMARVEDEERLRDVRKRYTLPERFVLFVGNSNPRKNLERLIKAFDLVRETGALPHQLVIAGEQGWKFDREQVLQGLKHREDIRFIGFVPDRDMPALYSAASLFVFPTLYEGFGIPVVEAQSCGTPVLTSNCSALPEVGGDAAMYVDPYDVKSIADGILSLLGNPLLAEALVEKGYQNAKRFSWAQSAARLHEMLEKEVGS